MYAFEQMLDLCNQKWQTTSHKSVAKALLLCNHRITTRDQLIEFGSAINSLTKEEVESLTVEGAVRLGIPFN